MAAGVVERAAELTEESLALARRHNQVLAELQAYICWAEVTLGRGDLAGAREWATEAVRFGRGKNLGFALWECVYVLAMVAAQAGQPMLAAQLAGAWDAEGERTAAFNDPQQQGLWHRGLAPAQAALGEGDWAVAYEAGRALSLEEAIAEALDETGGA